MVLLAHNGRNFDFNFLSEELRRAGLPRLTGAASAAASAAAAGAGAEKGALPTACLVDTLHILRDSSLWRPELPAPAPTRAPPAVSPTVTATRTVTTATVTGLGRSNSNHHPGSGSGSRGDCASVSSSSGRSAVRVAPAAITASAEAALVEASAQGLAVRPKSFSLGALYEHILGKRMRGSHNAVFDVLALMEVLQSPALSGRWRVVANKMQFYQRD